MSRIVSWFSCGAASAVATKLALGMGEPVTIAYCEVAEEHPDNKRFLSDCEEWFGQKIQVLQNEKYNGSIYEVFEKIRFLKGPSGARCTGELKKNVRKSFELPTDRQIFGYTVEEEHRLDRFIDANNGVDVIAPLIEHGLTKNDCLAMVERAGIELPAMYKLGYHNNNCIGCVKGETGYWNKIRIDFPEQFERMNKMEKMLGRSVCKMDMVTVKNKYPNIYIDLGKPSVKTEKGGAAYWRPTLDLLPPDAGNYPEELDVQCGIFCELAEGGY